MEIELDLKGIFPEDLMPVLDKLLGYLTEEELSEFNTWLKIEIAKTQVP